MNRDKLKDEEYFSGYIQNSTKRKANYIERIETLDDPQQGYINSGITLDLFTRNLLLAKYSSGYAVKELIEDYKESIKWFEFAYNSTSFYVQILWMISLGIMLDIEQEEFIKLMALVKKDNPGDYLIDFLLAARGGWEQRNKKFKFPVPYKSLEEVIIFANEGRKTEATERLRTYLEKEWYAGHSDTGWYDNHKSKNHTHAGYWSFESGAVVKILELDDSSLKEVQYYPYDMVHWKL